MPLDWGREASEGPLPAMPAPGAGRIVRGVGGAASPGGPPEVAMAIEGIGVALERLQKELSDLELRLAPVLLPEPPANATEKNPPPNGSPLTQVLRTIQYRITDMTAWMETVRGRLEV